jgi:hypothetical protein
MIKIMIMFKKVKNFLKRKRASLKQFNFHTLSNSILIFLKYLFLWLSDLILEILERWKEFFFDPEESDPVVIITAISCFYLAAIALIIYGIPSWQVRIKGILVIITIVWFGGTLFISFVVTLIVRIFNAILRWVRRKK